MAILNFNHEGLRKQTAVRKFSFVTTQRPRFDVSQIFPIICTLYAHIAAIVG